MPKQPASLVRSLPWWATLVLLALLWSQSSYFHFLIPEKVYAVAGTATFGGTGGTGGNVYGNIFYDHDNTARLVDPSSTTNSLNLAGPGVMEGGLTIRGGNIDLTNTSAGVNVYKNIGPDATASWSTGTAGGTARFYQSSVLFNGKIYSWAGYSGTADLNTLDIYDIYNNSWSTGTAGGTARDNHTSVLYNGKIYSWGGSTGGGFAGAKNTMDIYDIAGDSWSTGLAGGTARLLLTGILYNGKIYFWGGFNSSASTLNTIDIYDIAGNSWSTGTAGGTARGDYSAVLYNGKIYYWGGVASNGGAPLNTVDIYDIANNSWSTGTAGGTARFHHSSVLYNGKIYSWGGYDTTITILNTIDIYNISTSSWSTGTAGGTGRANFSYALYNGKIYFWGGRNSGGSGINTLDIYDIGDRQTTLTLYENNESMFSFRSGAQINLDYGRVGIMNGNVGIGTTSPNALLNVGSTFAGNTSTNVDNASTDAAAASAVVARNVNTGTAQTDGIRIIALGTNFTTIGGYLQDGSALDSGTNLSGGLSIMTRASAPIRFYTAGSADANERMRIDSAGNVGIGTTSPGARLDVQGGPIRLPYLAGSSFPTCTSSMAGAMVLWDTNTAAPANSVDCTKATASDRLYVCVEDFNSTSYAYRWECINNTTN